MLFSRHKTELVNPERALPGRAQYEYAVPATHFVNGRPIKPPFPDGLQTVILGSGCFWGTEELFWQADGVWVTAVVYAGGITQHPSYEEVCSGLTGHTEGVLVVYDPAQTSLQTLLRLFFETHDPTQGMRQGNDIGTQYRSAIYYTDESQREVAEAAKAAYSAKLEAAGYGPATTEIAPAGEFFYAEGYHQQYLAKNPNGYRCHSTTGVPFPA
ncbi:MAG: peptide-methionine (S)-S-oxide reductase [Pseudonocardiales bacterium]|jgi:peptide-methionine (S)-S-oxide reductase|nr:peptide-methionine (S)-S-oxide reductase [Pseudonocardiales bacterium]